MTALVTQPQAQPPMLFGADGAGINSQDIILPAISVRQNSYRKDYMKGFKPGDILSRPDNRLLATDGKPVQVVPVSIEKAYRICDITRNEARTVRYEAWFDEKPLVFSEGESQYRRDKCFVAHVLLREGLDSQARMFERLAKGEVVDPDDFVLPARIVFTRGGLNAGKVLNTHFEMSRAIHQNPSIMTFELRSVEMKNEKGNWYAFEVQKIKDEKTKYTPKELLPACDFWVKTMSKSQFKAHEEDEAEVVEAAADAKEFENRF